MADLSNITLNGVPLGLVIEAERREEINTHRADEQKSMSFVVSHSRGGSYTSMRNHSGCKSSKGRIIYSASAGGTL